MPIKIYWGPPGSYKTSSAVMDDVSTCAAQGRVLITNVRGLSEAKIREHAPKVSHGFKLIHLRNDDAEELKKLRTWWHWAPFGAFILLDEVQLVYPLKWTDNQIRALDASEGRSYDYVDQDGEQQTGHLPRELDLIFDMHRHGNWDLTFTLPSIKKVRPEIRAAAECAYKHKNMAIHGALFGGKFLQMQHLAEDNGNASDIYVRRSRKIKPWVFRCYDSTATAKVSDTKVGLNLLASPRVLGLLAVVAAAIFVITFVGMPKALGGGADESPKVDSAPAAPAPRGVPGATQGDGQLVAVVPGVKPDPITLRVIGVVSLRYAGYAVLYDGEGDIRIPAAACKRDPFLGWSCNWAGQVVTERTGKAPPRVEPPKTLFASLAPDT